MPELTHDTSEDGFHEIQFTLKQLVFIGMAAVAVFTSIFLCGVLVGRSVGAREAEPIDALVTQAPAAEPQPIEPPPAATEAAPADIPLPYHTELQKPRPTAELTTPEPQAAPVPPPAKPDPPAAPKAAVPAPDLPSSDVPTAGRPGTWFLQVTALRNRAAAETTVRTLVEKGYPAFLEVPAPGAPEFYRVRIGRYKDRGEADDVARRLQKEEQFSADIRR